MTGAWWPRRGWNPATLVVDRRPLIIRAVSLLDAPAVGDTHPHFFFHNPFQPPYTLFFSLFMTCAGLTLPRTSGASAPLFLISAGAQS